MPPLLAIDWEDEVNWHYDQRPTWNNEDSVFQDFATQPIISEAVFYSIDRNKDGYITKGELKLASRGTSMKKLSEIIDEIDNNSDGKLTLEEVKAIAKKANVICERSQSLNQPTLAC